MQGGADVRRIAEGSVTIQRHQYAQDGIGVLQGSRATHRKTIKSTGKCFQQKHLCQTHLRWGGV